MSRQIAKSSRKISGIITLFFGLIFYSESFAQSITKCLEEYKNETKSAGNLVSDNGNMKKYYEKRKSLYLEYFDLNAEFSPRVMVDNQRFVDVWVAHERGIIDIQQAFTKSRQYQIEILSEGPYDPRAFICKDKYPK